MFKKLLAALAVFSFIAIPLLFAAYPSDLVRTKNWGNEVLTDSDLEGQFDLIIDWVMDALDATSGHDHSGVANKGPKIPINTSLTIGSQAQGDLIYASSASAWARLGAGTNGQFLKTQGTGANPAWADVTFQTAASQAEVEAATNNTKVVTPAVVQYHPGVAKAWALFNGTGTPAFSVRHNFDASITDDGTGLWTLSFTTDNSGTSYVLTGTAERGDGVVGVPYAASRAAGTVQVGVRKGSDNALDDFAQINVVVHGDQ